MNALISYDFSGSYEITTLIHKFLVIGRWEWQQHGVARRPYSTTQVEIRRLKIMSEDGD